MKPLRMNGYIERDPLDPNGEYGHIQAFAEYGPDFSDLLLCQRAGTSQEDTTWKALTSMG
jgi:hypothetical protein